MSSQTPGQGGQLSPDGLWRWDGQRWVPVAQPAMQRPRPGSRSWIAWLAGGCALLLLVGVAAGIWGATALVRSVQSGGFSCLPSDFPKYPGATVARGYTYYGTGVAPGDTRECQANEDSTDDVATVTRFFAGRLGRGG